MCVCPTGYKLASDMRSCVGMCDILCSCWAVQGSGKLLVCTVKAVLSCSIVEYHGCLNNRKLLTDNRSQLGENYVFHSRYGMDPDFGLGQNHMF